MSQFNNILDATEKEEITKKKIGLPLLIIHLMEVISILIFVLGIYEKISSTQLIPGISLIYWGIITWVPYSLFIPIFYELNYKSKNPLNYILALIFGGLLSINLLGKLETIEFTQFIPGVRFTIWSLLALSLTAIFFPFYHEIKRKAPKLNYLFASLLSTSFILNFLSRLERIEHTQFIEGMSLYPYAIGGIIISLIYFIVTKSFFKGYLYHYLRFLLLLLIGF